MKLCNACGAIFTYDPADCTRCHSELSELNAQENASNYNLVSFMSTYGQLLASHLELADAKLEEASGPYLARDYAMTAITLRRAMLAVVDALLLLANSGQHDVRAWKAEACGASADEAKTMPVTSWDTILFLQQGGFIEAETVRKLEFARSVGNAGYAADPTKEEVEEASDVIEDMLNRLKHAYAYLDAYEYSAIRKV